MLKKILIIFICISRLFVFAADYHAEITHKVVFVKEWKPYYGFENGKPTGYAIELFEAIVKNTDLKYEYMIVDSFKDVIDAMQNGQAHIVPNIGINNKRADIFAFTQPTDTFDIYFYKRQTSFDIKKHTDLKDRVIGVVKNNVCEKLVDKVSSKVFNFESYSQGINELSSGRIDAFCYPKQLLDLELKKMNLNHQIVNLDQPIKEMKRGMAVSKDHFHLLNLLNEEITKLKISGEYYKIHQKYFGEKQKIELTKPEFIFIIFSLIGSSFTLVIVVLFFLNKKKWLMTKNTLNEEIINKTKELEIKNRDLILIQNELKEQTYTDQLTKIKNRKAYNEKLEELISSYQRYGRVFSIMMFDIDDFKYYNDNYGHRVGDRVLIEVGVLVKKIIRNNDYFFRIGGEEFIVLLSDTMIDEAKIVAEKIRKTVETDLSVVPERQITVSIGITEVEKIDSEYSIYTRVDKLMYKSKKSGKNLVSF